MRLFAFLLFLLVPGALATPALAQKRTAFSFDDVPRGPGGFMTVKGHPRVWVLAGAPGLSNDWDVPPGPGKRQR